MPYDRSSFLNLTMYAYTDTEKNMFQLFKYLKLSHKFTAYQKFQCITFYPVNGDGLCAGFV